MELLLEYSKYDLKQKLAEYLVFGSYPQVLTSKNKEEKIRILEELVNSYIFKDILALQQLNGGKDEKKSIQTHPWVFLLLAYLWAKRN